MIVAIVFAKKVWTAFKPFSGVFVLFDCLGPLVARPRSRFLWNFWPGGNDSEIFRFFGFVFGEFRNFNSEIRKNDGWKSWPNCFYFWIMKNLLLFMLIIFSLNIFIYSNEMYFKNVFYDQFFSKNLKYEMKLKTFCQTAETYVIQFIISTSYCLNLIKRFFYFVNHCCDSFANHSRKSLIINF